MGIRYLTVYAFSTENWKRSQEEVGGIFKLLVKFVGSELKELDDNNVKVNILGDWHDRVPEDARRSVQEALDTTCDNTGLIFNIALNSAPGSGLTGVSFLEQETKINTRPQYSIAVNIQR